MKMSGKEFRQLEHKAVTLIGMSGVGKTTLARKLPKTSWFHFSADYRIGTRYLSEPILDNIKEQAMNVPFLRDLLRSDSIFIGSAMTFDNLDLMSMFVGKIGNENLGGLDETEFYKRQELHRQAEVSTMLDVGEFVKKAQSIYGYSHFVNDASGSVCELNDQKVIDHLAKHSVIIYIAADESIEKAVIQRQIEYPKPLYYDPDFLDSRLTQFISDKNLNSSDEVEPDEFVRWVFPQLVEHRRPKYEALAQNHGYTVVANDVEKIQNEEDFVDMICQVLDNSNQE